MKAKILLNNKEEVILFEHVYEYEDVILEVWRMYGLEATIIDIWREDDETSNEG